MGIDYKECLLQDKRGSPFHRREYAAMLLGFHPYDYMRDTTVKEDYTKEPNHLKYKLLFLQYKRIMESRGMDTSEIEMLCKNREYKKFVDKINEYNITLSILNRQPWYYFSSQIMDRSKEEINPNEIKHRLYLNIPAEKRATFTNLFAQTMAQEQIPYLFKVYDKKNQNDTVVIYIEKDEYLEKTMDVINGIFSSRTDIASVTKEPTPHLFRVNQYIGYGFQPPMIDGKKQSYSGLMRLCELENKDQLDVFKDKLVAYFNGLMQSKGKKANFEELSKSEKLSMFMENFESIQQLYGSDLTNMMNLIKRTLYQKIHYKGNTGR